MSRRVPRDLVASVRGRLEQAARQRREDFQITLLKFGVERMLYRLTRVGHGSRFVLKGAMLFEAWGEHVHRATRDLDLLGTGAVDEAWLLEVMQQVCRAEVEPDGLDFGPASIQLEAIHEEQDHAGWHVTLVAKLGRTVIPIQVDIATGQAVDPPAEEIEYPGLLDFPCATLLAYPREVAIAEKFHALVVLGMTNSRMKDFFDIAYLADTFEFRSDRLVPALRATFKRRRTDLPTARPAGLSVEYGEDPDRLRDWRAFALRAGLTATVMSLAAACGRIEALVMPAVGWALKEQAPARIWRPGKGWLAE